MSREFEKEPPFDLRDRTKDFALRIVRMFTELPESDDARILGEQALRSGTAVGAHYREAHRHRAKPEFPGKINDCLKELEETAYWLELLTDGRIVPAAKLASLQDETHQLIAILTTIAKNLKPRMA